MDVREQAGRVDLAFRFDGLDGGFGIPSVQITGPVVIPCELVPEIFPDVSAAVGSRRECTALSEDPRCCRTVQV